MTVLRRALVALVAASFICLVVLNVVHLSAVLALSEPRRTVRLTMVAASQLAGLFALFLLVREFRGRAASLSAALNPAWLVIGLSLIDAYYASQSTAYLFVGLGAILMGLFRIATAFRRPRTAP